MGSACKLDDIIFWGTSPLNSREEEVRARISPDEFAEKIFNHTGSAPRRNKFHDMKAHLYYKKNGTARIQTVQVRRQFYFASISPVTIIGTF